MHCKRRSWIGINEGGYGRIVDYTEGKGYPYGENEDFTEANVDDVVYCILISIVSAFRRKPWRYVRLMREKRLFQR